MDEKQLIEGCKKGDRWAQKALYDKYSRRMMGVCLRYIKDRETARDVLQDGFILLFSNIGKSYNGGSLDGWIRKIFVNCALNYLRKKELVFNDEDIGDFDFNDIPDESSASRLSAEELMEYIRMLPNGFQTVFNLFAIEGYSHREIGKMLNIKESTSRSQYMRARNMLQEMIRKG